MITISPGTIEIDPALVAGETVAVRATGLDPAPGASIRLVVATHCRDRVLSATDPLVPDAEDPAALVGTLTLATREISAYLALCCADGSMPVALECIDAAGRDSLAQAVAPLRNSVLALGGAGAIPYWAVGLTPDDVAAIVAEAIAAALEPYATTEQVNAALAGYLPLTGGTATGWIRSTRGIAAYGDETGALAQLSASNGTLTLVPRSSQTGGGEISAPANSGAALTSGDLSAPSTLRSAIRYPLVAASPSGGALAVDDHAITSATVPAGTASLALSLPEALSDIARDILVRLDVADAGGLAAVTLPAGETVDIGADALEDLPAGISLLMLAEIAPSHWMIARRSV